jgi:anaerobic glycerol-3-phosphate dehydrogenase
MKSRFFSGVVTVMIVLVLTSCGKLPQTQIDTAKAAVDSAKLEQADIYVASEFTALQDSLNAYMAEVEIQKSKFFKSYGDVTVKLEALVAEAATVKSNSVAKKEEVRKEVEALMAEIAVMITDNNALILKAPKGKEGAAALEEIRNEMAVIEASVAEANVLFTNGEFMAAHDKAKAAMENATTINTELKEAIAKVTRR